MSVFVASTFVAALAAFSPVGAAPTEDHHVARRGADWPSGLTWANKAYLFNSNTDGVDVVEVDTLYSTKEEIQKYKSAGQRVICYMSAGTLEQKRPDRGQVPGSALSTWAPYNGEQWFNVMNWQDLQGVMGARMDMARAKGCDAIEADNMDCFQYDGCVPGTSMATKQAATKEYALWFAAQAHRRGMAIGLKNAFELIPDLVDAFDFAINESCPRFKQCDVYKPFVAKGKAVFGAEYSLQGSAACSPAAANGISMLYRSGNGYARC